MDTNALYAKLATIPPQIKSWLSSEVVVDYVNNIDDQFILPKESSSVIKKIAQRFLVKDITPDYFSGELAAELKLDKNKAVHISSEIKKNIFSPQKAAFSAYGIDIDLLDKFQMPIIKQSTGDSPKILEDSESKPVIAPLIAKPTTLSDIGWSKQPTVGSNIGVSAAIPTTTSAATPVPKPVAEPAPMMLHEDTTFKPAEKNVSFTLPKPGGTAEMSMNGGVQVPTRPAVLEFGGRTTSAGTPVPKPPTVATDSTRPIGFGVSFASAPTINNGARDISQIMPTAATPVPKPPTPPIPPQAPARVAPLQVPQPPRPPTSQNMPAEPQSGKPIVKDFL